MIIKIIKSFVDTTYDGEDLHILDVRRATELQQALETDRYQVLYIYGNSYLVCVALINSVISMKDFRSTICID